MKTARKLMAVDGAPVPQPEEPEEDFGSLEGDVCDATNMASILADMVEGLIHRDRDPRMPSYIYSPKEEEDKLAFAAHQVSGMLTTLKEKFYGILERELKAKRDAKGGAQ